MKAGKHVRKKKFKVKNTQSLYMQEKLAYHNKVNKTTDQVTPAKHRAKAKINLMNTPIKLKQKTIKPRDHSFYDKKTP